jgi:hypothetical protein
MYQAQYTLYVYIYTMSIHSVFLVSDLEVSHNGDPINGILHCLCGESRSSHGHGDP